MMKPTYLYILFALLLSSCENLFMETSPSEEPLEVFDNMWSTVDRKYSFFEYKNIDWEQIRTNYRSRITENMSNEELFYVLGDMLNELQDGHANLTSRFDISIYKGITRQMDEDGFFTVFEPDFYEAEILSQQYFIQQNEEDEEIKRADGFGNKIFTRQSEDGTTFKVAYIRYSSFMNIIDLKALDQAIERFEQENVKGLILDVRNNGGGAVSNVYKLGSRLIGVDEATVLETIYKSGEGRNDFTEPAGIAFKKDGDRQFTKPVALLINRSSYSATSMLAAAVRANGYEHVRSFGNNTGGGGGLPSDFQLPNGWYYRFSTTRTYTPFISTDDVFTGENHFEGVDGEALQHPARGFDYEAGVPVEFPISVEQFDKYKEQNKDYLMEAVMQLMYENPNEAWKGIPKGTVIDFDLPE